MAIREIRKHDDPCLRKVCRTVEKFDERLHRLLDDLAETMHDANGVGLAAPQVGILRRAVVIDIGDENGVIELVNPHIIRTAGGEALSEGCLSFPGEYGLVKRPTKAKIEAQDRFGNSFTMVGEDLLARAFCHELDHLDGKIFKDIAIKMLDDEDDE